MLCPHCQIKMTAFFAETLELDRCPQCEGLWLDLGEVERLHGLAGLFVSQVASKAICPRGHGALRTGGIDRLEADVCPKCRGAFIPETQPERAPAPETRPAGVAAVSRVTAICDTCGKKTAVADGTLTAGGFQCQTCKTQGAAAPGDRTYNLIGHVLDSLKVSREN